MLEKIFKALGNVVFLGEQARRNADDIRELRNRIEDIVHDLDRLKFEVQRTRENEAHEREKLLLKIERMFIEHSKSPHQVVPTAIEEEELATAQILAEEQ